MQSASASVVPTMEGIDEEGMEYRLSGTVGHATSTVTGKANALVHFNDFLATKKMKSFKELSEEELCSLTLFQQYGTYISEYARNKRKVRQHRYLCVLVCAYAVLPLLIACAVVIMVQEEGLLYSYGPWGGFPGP